MKALLPPVPVLATESLEQFEKVFDQVLVALAGYGRTDPDPELRPAVVGARPVHTAPGRRL
jgi:hypothetical protein